MRITHEKAREIGFGGEQAAIPRSNFASSMITYPYGERCVEIATIPRLYGLISPNLTRHRGFGPIDRAGALKG